MSSNPYVNETPENLALRVLQCHRLPKKCTERKTAFENLIELTRIGAPPLKIVAAQQISRFLDDFPDLEEDAINAVYDLCEDSLTEVRVEGYKAIVSVSRANRKWLKRNVDVLVQLLQIDQDHEVLVVKTALGEHLEIDTKVTISVLCDQLVIPKEPITDEDERMTRERLRSLVLSYLVDDAKKLIVDECKKNPHLSRDVVSAIQPALQQFDLQDLCTLLDKLVFALPGYARFEDGTTDLFPSLIKTAAEHIEPPELGSARPLLSLLLSLATVNMPRLEKFLNFVTPKFLQGSRLEKYNVADRVVILSTYGEALSAFQFPGKTQVRNAAWNVCPYVVQQLNDPVHDKAQGKALKSVLDFCMQCISRCPDETPKSQPLVDCARKITANQDLKHLHHIARLIVDGPARGTKRPFKQRQDSQPQATTSNAPQAPAHLQSNKPHLQARQQRNSFSGVPNRQLGADQLPRPQKRARTDDDVQQQGAPPSLLHRMNMGSGKPYSAPSTPNLGGHANAFQHGGGRGGPPRQDQQAQNDSFAGQLSIKGAATRQVADATRQATQAARPQVSLLERLADPSSAPRGGRGGGGRKGRKGQL
ncbi:hypothetical protein K525DRAFT_280197 [Schizophyllum commune Loenen D]|nr:hypothetical protein K525DRAFT_280197 [Schizophyllum commune Loenen D]